MLVFTTSIILSVILNTAFISGAPKCPSGTKISSELVFFPHEYVCERFYLCHDGIGVLLKCPKYYKFDLSTSQCDCEENTRCLSRSEVFDYFSNQTNQVETNDSEEEATEENREKGTTTGDCPIGNSMVDVYLKHESSNCSKYYKCSNGAKIEMGCPANLHFNLVLKTCDWPQNVKCSLGKDEAPSTTPRAEKCSSGDVFPHETNCRFYYKCVKGKKVEKACLGGLYFNPEEKYCEYTESNHCPEKGFMFSHPSDCRTYFVVRHGVMHEHQCHYPSYFDEKKKKCVSNDVNC